MAAQSGPRGFRRLWREVAVTIGALLGVVCLTVVVLGAFFGIRPLVFTSGSMSPDITTGALAFAHRTPASDLSVGDVVSVVDSRGVRVTHRVVATSPSGEATSLRLKGDANQAADAAPYVVTTGDRVLFDVPRAGYVVVWMSSPAGLAVGGLLVGLALLAAFSPSQGPRHVRPAGRRVAARFGAAGTVLVLATQASVQLAPTQAFWTDSMTATSGTFSALTIIPNPTTPGCVDDGTHVDGTFTTQGARFQYRVTANRTDTGAQVGSPVFVTGSPAHLRQTDFATTAAFQATGTYNFTYRVSTAALNTTTWLSSGFIAIPVHFSGSDYLNVDCGSDTSTTVAITSATSDSGGSATDFVTNVASNSISGTGEPGATIVVKRGTTQVATATVGTGGTWTSTTFTLVEGVQDLTATATDLSGNTATATRQVRLDTVAPTVTQTAPCSSIGNAVTGVTGATWCKLTSISLTATFADSDSGIQTGTSQVNNNGAGYAAYTGAVSLAESAARVVNVRASDVAGNTTTSTSTYYIDGTAPTISIDAPVASTTQASALRTAVTTACGAASSACGPFTDAVSGPVSVRWKLERTPALSTAVCMNASGVYAAATCSSTFAGTVSGGRWSLPVVPTTSYTGLAASYVLTVSGATDAAGNVANTVTRSFGTLL